jgi:hypothetical protein
MHANRIQISFSLFRPVLPELPLPSSRAVLSMYSAFREKVISGYSQSQTFLACHVKSATYNVPSV